MFLSSEREWNQPSDEWRAGWVQRVKTVAMMEEEEEKVVAVNRVVDARVMAGPPRL